MSMTRSNFNALATNLFYCQPSRSFDPESVNPGEEGRALAEASARYQGWWEAVRAVADECEDSNHTFNRGRFIKACEHGLCATRRSPA